MPFMKPVMTFEELIKNHSADVIEKLITEVLSKDFIEIHFDFLEETNGQSLQPINMRKIKRYHCACT
jgi:hypothetical protein